MLCKCAQSSHVGESPFVRVSRVVQFWGPMLLAFGRTVAKTCSLPPVPPFSSCMHASTAPPRHVSITV